MQYEGWEDAKRGIISRRRFVKLHVLADARGKKIVSCEITKGTAHYRLGSGGSSLGCLAARGA